MADASYAILDRGVLRVGGEDRRAFLQGLVSNDVTRATADRVIWSAFLTAQGKFLHEFFLVERDGAFLLDCEAARAADLARRLKIYKLRSKATVEDAGADHAVAALFGAGALAALGLDGSEVGAAVPFAGGVAFVDPRLKALGARALLPRSDAAQAIEQAGFAPAESAAYDTVRVALGVPDGSRDMVVEKAILLENGFDELHGLDWDKGCYMGQELTARTRYRGLIKKRLLPVAVDGPLPEPGTQVLLDGKDAGEMRSGVDGVGLALLRLQAVERAAAKGLALTAGSATLTPRKPDWARF